MPTYALLLAYDGGGFAGWWRQPGLRTVAGELDAACARLGEAQARALGASRTDAGVHARGQVAQLLTRRAWTERDLATALARQLPGDCACLGVAAMPEGWHPVHDACAKTYVYTLDAGVTADPFSARYAWRLPFALRLSALAGLAKTIPGRRDWRCFARRGETRGKDALVRTITEAAWRRSRHLFHCEVTGTGFTYRLVRSLVGAMVAVAHGSCDVRAFSEALDGAVSSPAGRQQAPAHGLCLHHVRYQAPLPWVRARAGTQRHSVPGGQ